MALPTFHLSLLLNLWILRGKGPLKNSSDVINAAKKIAEAGSRMDKLARAVADQVGLKLLFAALSIDVKPTLTVSLLVSKEHILN